MTRVFLVDDYELVRRGLAELLDAEADLEVVGESDRAAHTLGRVAATRPDLVVIDLRLPDGNGIDLCRSILLADPRVRCVILTAFPDAEARAAAADAGASGYLLKSLSGRGLVDDLRRIAGGQSVQPERVAEQAPAPAPAPAPAMVLLSLRERQALRLITDGLSNRQIGERLGLTEKTVKNYVCQLMRKLGMHHRSQVAAYGVAVASARRSPSSGGTSLPHDSIPRGTKVPDCDRPATDVGRKDTHSAYIDERTMA
ncbi:MAG TPA: response regulator transcription factor [Lacisediminihabitans sp.]|uniref:response regulator transcription factor n=1 Tax=Lacisediminihabitans sp. TaxID=2787631 RepID=UPI002EDB6A62